MRVFLYGSLLDPTTLAARSGEPGLLHRLEPAVLDGWCRVRLRGTNWPTLRRAPGAQAQGALLAASASALRSLARYEGPAYRLTPVVVRCGARPVSARAWIAPGATTRRWGA